MDEIFYDIFRVVFRVIIFMLAWRFFYKILIRKKQKNSTAKKVPNSEGSSQKMLSANDMRKNLFYKDTVSLTLRFPLQGNANNVRFIKLENTKGLEDLKVKNIKYNLPKFTEAEIKQLKGEVCFRRKKPQEFEMSEFYDLVKSYNQEGKSPDTDHLLNSFIYIGDKSSANKSTDETEYVATEDYWDIPDFEEFDFVDITDIHLYGEKAGVSYKDHIVNEGLMPGFGLRIFYSNIRECILSKANQGYLTDENKGTLSGFWAIEAKAKMDVQRDFHENFFDTCFVDSSGDFEAIWLKKDTFILDTNPDWLNEFPKDSDKRQELVIQCAFELGPALSIAFGIDILLPINPTEEAVQGKNAPVYVDFGTSSTCIARKREVQKDDYSLVRLSDGGKSEDEESKYENSSNLLIYNFDHLDSHIEELKSGGPAILYALLNEYTAVQKDDRKDFAFGGTLENTLKIALLNSSGDDVITEKFLDSYLKEIKTIPYRNAQKQQKQSVTIKSFWGQKSGRENITLGCGKDFDPIMLYGYLVGYKVNGPYEKNLYTNFKLSMPVKFHDEIKNSVLASFREGLRYRLPSKIVDRLNVGISCSEPAAIAKAMIGEDISRGKGAKSKPIIFDIDQTNRDNREPKLFAIFDYGGGTLDMAGGLLRGPHGSDGVSERKESRTKVLQWLAEDGDADVGGEKIIEYLTHVFTLENLKQLVENEISMPLPLKEVWESSKRFELKLGLQDKGESTDYEYAIYEKYGASSSKTKLVKDKELAERNFKMIAETFSRKYWYAACPKEAIGFLTEERVTLMKNNKGRFDFLEGSSLDNIWKLDFGTPLRDFLKKEVIVPFQRFLQNLQNPNGPNRSEFSRHEYHGEKDPPYVFMAGNVCKSKIIDELFDEMYTELYGKDDAVLNKAKSRLLNLAQHPVDKVEKNCKTIVAIGASCSSPYIKEISIPKQRFLYDICWKLDRELLLFAPKDDWNSPPRYRECVDVNNGVHFYDNIDEFLDAFQYGEHPHDLLGLSEVLRDCVKAEFAQLTKDLILEICPVEGPAQNELKLKCYERNNSENFKEYTLVLKEV